MTHIEEIVEVFSIVEEESGLSVVPQERRFFPLIHRRIIRNMPHRHVLRSDGVIPRILWEKVQR